MDMLYICGSSTMLSHVVAIIVVVFFHGEYSVEPAEKSKDARD